MILTGHKVSAYLTTFLLLAPIASAKINSSPPIDLATAITRWQWVGIKTVANAPCPIPAGGNWQVGELFTGMSENTPPPGLRPFCLYRYVGSGSVSAVAELELFALRGNGLQQLDSDAMAVGSSAPPESEVLLKMWQPMAEHFANQVDEVTVSGWHFPRARLAILDTAPTGTGLPLKIEGNSQHGYTLMHMADQLLCPNGDCLAQLSSRLTMPYISFNPLDPAQSVTDTVNGGLIGTLTDLAQAIQSEMQQALFVPGDSSLLQQGVIPRARVVLNLSLGWDPIFGGLESYPSQMPANVQAVYAAVQDAVCRGAVIFAAAGNFREGPDVPTGGEVGPLLPAAWEQVSAPTERRCQTILESRGGSTDGNGFTKDFTVPPTEYKPMIHSVGGLRSNGTPLANARQQGAPRLAAFADHAVVEGHEPGKPTDMLTGSSVSSLVAAATAAAAWSLDWERTGQTIAERLYDTGTPLLRQADYCLGNQCPQVRRTAFCPVLQASCGTNGGCSVQIPPCKGWQTMAPHLDMNAMVEASQPDFVVNAELLVQPLDPSVAAQCGSEQRYSESGLNPEDPCPERQYHGLGTQAWLAPQPASDPCGTCTLFPNSCCQSPEHIDDPAYSGMRKMAGNEAALLIDIDEDFEGILTGATITLCEVAYSFPLASLEAGQAALIEHLPVGECPSALLSFTVKDQGEEDASTTSAPLYARNSSP